MKTLRKKLIIWLFEFSQRKYTAIFKNHKPWDMSAKDLLQYPETSFGRHLGEFLKRNNFELLPKVERHDCYHVLCNYGTNVEDEIALQCLCLGNGKQSPYLYGAIILGILILPDYYKYYYQSYKIGKSANAFYHYDYRTLLDVSIDDFRTMIFSKSQLFNLLNHNLL